MPCCWLRPQLTRHLKERAISDDARAARLVACTPSHAHGARWRAWRRVRGARDTVVRILPEGSKNAHFPRGTRSDTIRMRAKKVTPTVAAGSARAAREVDADDRGEGGDKRHASHAARGSRRARPARRQRATARSCLSREKNCALCTRIPVREKSHINSPTRRFAGAAAARRRDYRRAATGAHSCALTARVSRRARRGVSSRARAGGPAFRARHLANTAF